MVAKNDPAVFHTTLPDNGDAYDEYRLENSAAGQTVALVKVTLRATLAGASTRIQKQQWEVGAFLSASVLPAAKIALQNRMDADHAHRT
jgi:hypothetical protein